MLRTFFISHADVAELTQLINSMMRINTMPVQPVVLQGKTANTITVRATEATVNIIERFIRSNDKPRAEVVIDIQILEVNRQRVKRLGLNLTEYALGMTFSPEVAPPNTSTPPSGVQSPPPFNLNTISQGVSTSDFYLAVPAAVLRFLATDSQTKLIAKPQLRGAEGAKLTLNLGDDIPVVQTVFGAAVAGGFASIPQSSFTYRTVGIIVEITPRVTYEGDIKLEMSLESSALGPNISVAGQDVPSFSSRKVTTTLRLREGESNLLAGLLRDEQRKIVTGFPGLMQVPILRSLFGQTNDEVSQSDIVMLLTPRIIRTHQLTAEDLAPIYMGTQQNVGLGGPPPLIAPPARRGPDGSSRRGTAIRYRGCSGHPAGRVDACRCRTSRGAAAASCSTCGCSDTEPAAATGRPGQAGSAAAASHASASRGVAAGNRGWRSARRHSTGDATSGSGGACTDSTGGSRHSGERNPGADHHHADRPRVAGGRRTVPDTRIDQQRVARVDAVADDHV